MARDLIASLGSTLRSERNPMLHVVAVGVDEYRDAKVRRLDYAAADAKAIADLFGSRISADEVRVDLILNSEATRDRVIKSIGERLVKEVRREDTVLLYFACHGSPERDHFRGEDRPYLILHDTSHDEIYSTGIEMVDTVPRWFDRLDVSLVVLLLDTCFSGAAGRSFCGPLHLRYRDEFHSDEPVSLQDLVLGRGRVILAAAGNHQPALESPEHGHGVFTHHLLSALRQPPSIGGEIGLGTLGDIVARRVSEETGGAQVPVLKGRTELAALPLLGTAL